MSGSERDVVVVGGGHNGLLAAAYLSRAGMDTLLLERNERVGGAVVSGEVTEPGFVHDLFATNMNLFLGSPAFAELGEDLARHGLAFATTEKPYANVFPDGRSLRVYRDGERTRELLGAHHRLDLRGWDALRALYERFAPTLFELYGSRLPSRAAAGLLWRGARGLGVGGLSELARLLSRSTRSLGNTYFATPEAKAMAAAWGMHLDFGPDVPSGAMFPFLELFTDMDNGISIVAGGASRLPEALTALIAEAGGELRTSAPVARILTRGRRAVGVELDSGERILARRAVIANVTPRLLFGGLLSGDQLPGRFFRRISAFEYGPGTMMIHLALDRPVSWSAGEDLDEFGYVHVGPYTDDMSRTYVEAVNGYLPVSPLLVVGQSSAVDPGRAPDGGHVLWVQVRMLPTRIAGDAAGVIEGRSWAAVNQPYAERVLDKLEVYAPGVRGGILGMKVYGPDDLERHNPNLVGGDSLGGSHHLGQNGPLRPVAGWSGYRTPLKSLYMVGSGTWPGAGVNAISGRLVAGLVAEDAA